MSPYIRALSVLPSKYVTNWFNAATFFNTQYTSELLKENYFITMDAFLETAIWAVRYINKKEQCIETITDTALSEKDCKVIINNHRLKQLLFE